MQELEAFHRRFGHTRVPSAWKENPKLAAWTTMQRSHPDRLTADLKKRLDQLGFDWTLTKKATWQRRYQQLEAFYRRFGHSMVPFDWAENPELAHWVVLLREKKRSSLLQNSESGMLFLKEVVIFPGGA